MIEILLKNRQIVQVNSVNEISDLNLDFYVMQFIDYSTQEISWVEQNFGADFSIMKNYEDIEISSHFLATDNQVAFHISIPYYNEDKKLDEDAIFFIISSSGLFFFSSSEVDVFLIKLIQTSFLNYKK
jgi:magnesium transporter